MPVNTFAPSEQVGFLQLLLNSTAEGFYSVDTEGNTTLCNKAFLRMLGFDSAEEVLGRKLHGVIHHSHPDGSHYDVADCPIYRSATGQPGAFVPHELFFRKDGSSFPVEYRAEPLIEDGVPKGAICTFIDISDRLSSEAAIQKSEGRFRELFEQISEGFCVIEMLYDEQDRPIDYRFVEVNPAFEEQTGLTNAVGRTMRSLAPQHEQRWFDIYGRVAKTGEPVRLEEYAGALGRWYEISAFRPERAEPLVAILFNDVTVRKQADERARQAQEHLSLMVESATDFAIISTDKLGSIVSWNIGAEQIFGYTADEMIGQPIGTIFTPEDRESGAPEYEMTTAAKKGRASDERWHQRKDGVRLYASGIMAAMQDQSGAVTGFLKIARDTTTERHAQQALEEARNSAEAANIAKTEFLANMSHEIRTPMNAIIGLSNLLGMSQPLTSKQREFIKTLQSSGDALLSLINDLLDIAKIEARSVELEHIPFSVTHIMQEVVSMMAVQVKEKGLTFTGDGECVEQRMFMGDPTRLRQIITNLCSNAIKFTETGDVHVSIACEPCDVESFETIVIAVKDSGIGIAPDQLGTIFHKFIQADSSINRKYGGTGLGLAITKTLTEIMGGSIAVESEAGVGSTFTVRIPIEIATHKAVAEADFSLTAIMDSAIERKIRARVLLVEDYEPNVLVARIYLEQFGYQAEIARNGLQAFEMATSGQYIAALMDVQMHGMNGLDATRLIREHEVKNKLPPLPIIGMTAHALSGDRERCLGAGMNDYLSKPFNPTDLAGKLKRLLEVA